MYTEVCKRTFISTFQPGPGRTALAKKGGEKGRSAINEAVAREHTANIHKHLCGAGFEKRAPRAPKELWKFATKVMGAPDVRIHIRLDKAVRAKGVRNVPNTTRTKIPQTSSVWWLPMYWSPLLKIYRQLM